MASRIIIVGGGFSGVACARTLRRALSPETCEIVLFSRENNMVFSPLLAEVAGAGINPDAVTVPLRQVLPGVRCRTEEVRQIDMSASLVEYEAHDGRHNRMAFDHVVLACGTSVNLNLVPGMADHALPLKSVGDAISLRFHVMEQLEKAEVCADPNRQRWHLSFVVVGGGFTGVETAGAINDLVRASTQFYGNFRPEDVTVTLVHSRDYILPEVGPTLREFARRKMEQAGIRMVLNARATLATAEGIELQDGRMIRGATVVCTIGSTMPLLVQRLDLPKKGDRLLTDPDMRVHGVPNLWAIGDCAHIINAYDAQVSPTTGQFAERQGRQAAKNIIRTLHGESTKPFFFKPLGQLCGIGERNAVAEILGVRLSGFPAWILWRTVYLLKTPSWSRRIKVAFDWIWELLFPRDLAYIKINPTERITRAHYRPGDYVFFEGEPAMHFYVIEQGEVEVLRCSPGGGPDRVVAVLQPGQFFGEMALLADRVHSASVRARTAVEVIVMGKAVFSRISQAFTPLRDLLAQALLWRRSRSNPILDNLWGLLEHEPLSKFIEPLPEHWLTPDNTAHEAVLWFDAHAAEFLCVLEKDGSLNGLVTRYELLEAFFVKGKSPETTVREFMRPDPVTVTPDETTLAVGELLNKHDLLWVPVVESTHNRRLIGIIRVERVLRFLTEGGRTDRPVVS